MTTERTAHRAAKQPDESRPPTGPRADRKADAGVDSLRKHCHGACIACRPREQGGLGLHFSEGADGSVEGVFPCAAYYQSYEGRLHGGVIATLLDAAMTHCLFAHGVSGVTAKLEIQFRHPVEVGVDATVRARLVSESPLLYVLEGKVLQNGRVRAVGKGIFTTNRERG